MIVLLDNKVHNALLNWLRSHRVKAFGVKLDSDKKEIQIYTNKPGILIQKKRYCKRNSATYKQIQHIL